MHTILIDSRNIRTDLYNPSKISCKNRGEYHKKGCKIVRYESFCSMIYFKDITDSSHYSSLKEVLVEELKRFIKVKHNDIILVVGLGNPNSTPDSLGPKTLDSILVTRYLFLLGKVDSNYSNVSILKPDVLGNTGIESFSFIRKMIEEIHPTKVIVIDSLKANHLRRLVHTIQITNQGIFPGSGVENFQGEISKKTVGCDVIAIGVPTVIDFQETKKSSFLICPSNIDFLIQRFSLLIGDSLNILFHKDYLRQK